MRRGKAIFKWICILGGGMLVLLLVLAAGFYWMTGRPLAKRLAELREAGEPVCLKDLERKPVPADENGAVYLLEGKAEIEAVVNDIYKKIQPPDGSKTPEDIDQKIHELLAAHPKIMPLLQKAAAAPEFQFPLDYHVLPSQFISNILPEIQYKRNCLRYLKSQAEDLLKQGQRDEAMRTALLMLQLTRKFDRDCPILVNYLVNVACKGIALDTANQILQSGPVEEKERAELDAELAKLDSLESCHTAMKGERAYSLDMLQNEFAPKMKMLAFQSNQWQLGALDMYDDFFKYADQPYSKIAGKMKPPSSTTFSILRGPASQMLPACNATLEAAIRSQAKARALRLLNALQHKAPAEGGKIPSMEELGLPKEVGIDPFNGQAMIVKKTPEGWMVYSVGKDLKDDGGKLGNGLDVGFGPQKYMVEEEEKGTTEAEK